MPDTNPQTTHFTVPISPCSMSANPTVSDEEKRQRRREQARERMARRRAAIKELPTAMQEDLFERARASRAKYRAQHRLELIHKERARREHKSILAHTLDKFISRRRVRASTKNESPVFSDPIEHDELMSD